MSRKSFKFDMLNNAIIGSAASLKKAGDPSTPQYKELCAMKKMQPTFTVAVAQIATNKRKQTYSGLTMEAMETFIHSQKNNAKALDEFETLRASASYPIVKSWFLSNYKGVYKKTETKRAITKAKIQKITAKGSITPIAAEMRKEA